MCMRLPDARICWSMSLLVLKTFAVGENSPKRDCLLSVTLHADRIVNGRRVDSIVEWKWPLENKKTVQESWSVSKA